METGKGNLGLYLKELRIVKNMTLREVEKTTGDAISNAYLCQLENGKISKPSPHVLQVLAKSYNVPYEDIMAVAGYIKTSSKEISSGKGGLVFYNRKDITDDEKAVLLSYLQFYRASKAKQNNER
ncbi:MAG: helix-turn-helix transcriptional regulator [Candidatus Omnitrophota bacterium]